MAKKTGETVDYGEGKGKKNPSKIEDITSQASKQGMEVMGISSGKFTEEDMMIIEQDKERIDFSDTNELILYGTEVSSGINEMTDKIISDDKLGSLKEIGGELTELIVGLNTLEDSKDGLSFFERVKSRLMKSKISRMNASDAIHKLEDVIHEAGEKVDSYIPELNELRDNNIGLIKRLGLLVEAGKQKIEEEKARLDELEQEYLGNDGRIDEIESANLDTIRRNIKQFTQRIQDIERMAIVAVTNIAQINIIIDAAVNTKTKMLQLQETAIPIIQMQTAVSKMASDVQAINEMGTQVSDKMQTILMNSAKMTRDLATSSATQAHRPVIEDKTFKQVVGTLIQTQADVKRICEEGERKLLQGNNDLRKQLSAISGDANSPKQIENK